MEEIDRQFSDLFLGPPSIRRAMSIRSQRSEMKEEGGLQRRPSIKNRILGVFQSSKNSKEPPSESVRSLRRKSHQQVERISPWSAAESAESKGKMVERGLPKSMSTSAIAPASQKIYPPSAMDRYPALTMQSHSSQPALPRPNLPSQPTAAPTTASKSRNVPSTPRRLSLQPSTTQRKPSTVSTRTFSFSRRLSMQAEDNDSPNQPVTVPPPASLASQIFSSFRDNSQKHSKTNSTSTGRDSKFSSVSSLPSLKSLESTPRTSTVVSPIANMSKPLSHTDFAQLESIVRRVERRLNQQYEQCQQLSANLVRLSGRKIQSLAKSEALLRSVNLPNKPEIIAMRSLISNTKEKARVMFLKKSAVIQRSTFALAAAKEAITNAKRDQPEGTYIIDMEPFQRLRYLLKEDLAAQRKLDRDMKEMLESLRKNPNFQQNLRDRFEMGQFGPFVDGRLGIFDESYCKVEVLCERIGTIGI